MNTNNKTQVIKSGLIANGNPEMKIVDMPMMTMPTVGQIATVLGNKLDEKVIAPIQLTAEEIAMNVRAAGTAMSQDGRGRGVAAGAAKLGAGVVAVAAMASCTETTIDPNAIDYSTDNPAHKAEFMKDVKPAILFNGTAKLTFEAVWVANTNGKGGNYKLKPIPVIDFTRVKELLEYDAQKNNIPLDKMGLEFFVARSGGSGGIGYAIPYSYIISKSGEQTMKFEDFTQYIPENASAKPDVAFSKSEVGFLRVSSLSDLRVKAEIITQFQTINPYIFGN